MEGVRGSVMRGTVHQWTWSGIRFCIGEKLMLRIPQWGHLLTAQLWVYGSAQWRSNCLGCIWTWASSLMPIKNKWVKIKIQVLCFFFISEENWKLGLTLWAGPSLFTSPQLLMSGTMSMCMFPHSPHIPGQSNPKPQKEIYDICFLFVLTVDVVSWSHSPGGHTNLFLPFKTHSHWLYLPCFWSLKSWLAYTATH